MIVPAHCDEYYNLCLTGTINEIDQKRTSEEINYGLVASASSGDMNKVMFLIDDKEADISFANYSCIRSSIESGHNRVAKYLYEKSRNKSLDVFMEAVCKTGNEELLDYILPEKKNICGFRILGINLGPPQNANYIKRALYFGHYKFAQKICDNTPYIPWKDIVEYCAVNDIIPLEGCNIDNESFILACKNNSRAFIFHCIGKGWKASEAISHVDKELAKDLIRVDLMCSRDRFVNACRNDLDMVQFIVNLFEEEISSIIDCIKLGNDVFEKNRFQHKQLITYYEKICKEGFLESASVENKEIFILLKDKVPLSVQLETYKNTTLWNTF